MRVRAEIGFILLTACAPRPAPSRAVLAADTLLGVEAPGPDSASLVQGACRFVHQLPPPAPVPACRVLEYQPATGDYPVVIILLADSTKPALESSPIVPGRFALSLKQGRYVLSNE